MHPHDDLIITPCGHCYSEAMWKAKLATKIDQTGVGGKWTAQRSR